MKGRTPPPRALPSDTDERRIAAALKACEGISTAALESGLVADALNELGQVQFVLALAAEAASQGKNPELYVNFANSVKHTAAISMRLEASGFNEAMNRAWEARTGEKLSDAPGDIVLDPLGTRKKRRRRP